MRVVSEARYSEVMSRTSGYLLACFLGLLAVATAIFFLAQPALGEDEYERDELGLIIHHDVTSRYGVGDDHWEVWVCDSPDGDLDLFGVWARESVRIVSHPLLRLAIRESLPSGIHSG